jgi:light-regulated signal transduction histidine kinase (bacteriophytochrome)
VQVLGATQDITELKRAEDEVRALNQKLERRVAERTAELERANQDLEAFSYSVSHDLRAPLRAINGFSHLVLETDHERLSEEGRGLLDRVVRNSDRMGRLIEDILAYSRAGRSALNRGRVELAALVQGVVEDLRPEYPRTEIAVGELPVVSGDATMLRQVFANLLGNACKFSSHRPQPRVGIRCTPRDDAWVIDIADNGAGFDMAYADRLFGMFQRMHTESEFPGSGVGLAIVKRLVERHGGRVWAESAPDRGATFSLTLAVDEPEADAGSAGAAVAAAPAALPGG